MRRQDRLIACELEPRAAGFAENRAQGREPAPKCWRSDGWMALNANVPPKERRGVVIVDPPYEESADFTRLSATLAEAHREMADRQSISCGIPLRSVLRRTRWPAGSASSPFRKFCAAK